MSRPRKAQRHDTQDVGVALAAPTVAPFRLVSESWPYTERSYALREVQVMTLSECIIAGVRRFPGEQFYMTPDRAKALSIVGHVIEEAVLDRMPPAMAAKWRAQGRVALADHALVCDGATADLLWSAPGRILTPDGVPSSYEAREAGPFDLRVLQLTQYDPGCAVYRYHSAANTVRGVVSAFARFGWSNPACHVRQWDGDADRRTVELLALTADVIHCHMDYRALHHDLKYALHANQRAAITYHGSVLPGDERRTFVDHEADRRMGALQFGARPYHGRHGVTNYLPIPVPVRDYRALAQAVGQPDPATMLRVAHSPTKREIKGTAEFLSAVDRLRARGHAIEAVLIEHMDHGEALRLKASCHATFDSFWLGMQGSGLEAAAMGQVVLAGDELAAKEAADLNGGAIPWTFAPDGEALIAALERLVQDAAWRRAEAARVADYVGRLHDYPAVGARYVNTLTQELGRGAA